MAYFLKTFNEKSVFGERKKELSCWVQTNKINLFRESEKYNYKYSYTIIGYLHTITNAH